MASPDVAAALAQQPCRFDIHCHCLPGLDDGPATLGESIALCRALVADGTTAVIATPHQLGRYDSRNDAKAIRQRVTELQQALRLENIPLIVLPGGDVRLDERLVRLVEEDRVSTIADNGKYLLIELPHEVYLDPARVLERMCAAGLVPVLTHPERHRYLQQRPDLVVQWVEKGAVLQLTAGSIVGDFGHAAQVISRYWIKKGWVGVVASDAHGAQRPPRMSAAMSAIEAQFGPELANVLCVVNPTRIVAGEAVALAKWPGLDNNASADEQVRATGPDQSRLPAAALG